MYTTGSETEWSDVLAIHDAPAVAETETPLTVAERYLVELPGHRERTTSVEEDEEDNVIQDSLNAPLLFIQAEHLPLVALCGLLASRKEHREQSTSPEILQGVLSALSLQELSTFSLRVRRPYSDQEGTTLQKNQEQTIDYLEEIADHHIQQGADSLFVFDMSKTTNVDRFGTAISLFRRLNTLYEHTRYYDPPLQTVSLFFKRTKKIKNSNNANEPNDHILLPYDWLSDGERSFLGRMALFALFRAPDMLIMLDEPEVHFNDVWKREIVNILDTILQGQESHALITTHSSIALTDVRKEDIIVLERGENDTTISQKPTINTLGADPSDILVHVFKSHSASGERSVTYLRKEIAERDAEGLKELEQVVAPGYWRYRIQLEKRRLSS